MAGLIWFHKEMRGKGVGDFGGIADFWKDLGDCIRMNLVDSVGNSVSRVQFDGVELGVSDGGC